MAKDEEKEKLVADQHDSRCRCICRGLVVGSVLVIVVMIILLALYNPDVNKCGYASFPLDVVFDQQEVSLRSNIDILALNADGSKGSKAGEIFKKLVSKVDLYRLLNQDGNLIASLTKNSNTQYTVDSCTAGPDFIIERQEFLWGNCSDSTPNWHMSFRVSSYDGVRVTALIASEQVARNATTIHFYDADNSQLSYATVQKQGNAWSVHISANSTFGSSFIFYFIPVIIGNYVDQGFNCQTSSSSPSASLSPTPSSSPSASVSHSAANHFFSLFATLFSLAFSIFLLQ